MRKVGGVGVIKDKDLKLEEIEVTLSRWSRVGRVQGRGKMV